MSLCPDQWLDNELLVEICFATPPTRAVRAEIAAVFERASHRSSIAAQPWLWADRYALLELDERFRSPVRNFKTDLPEIVAAIHAVAPIERAVFVGGGAHAIDPGDGPRWGGWAAGRTTREVDGEWVGEIDDEFEADREAAAAEAEAAAAEADRTHADSGELVLVPCADVPELPAMLPPARAKELCGDRAALRLPARCVALAPDGTLAIGDAAELHVIDARGHRSFPASFPSLLAFVRDGRGLVVGMERREYPTVVLGLRDGVIRELGRLEVEIASLYSSLGERDGRIFASAGYELRGFDAAWQAAFAGDPTEDEVDLEEL